MAPQLPPANAEPLTPVVDRAAIAAPPAPAYRRLTAAMCQELAVRNSEIATVLQKAALDSGGGKKKHHGSDAGEARAQALLFAAEEARNRAAGEALDMYYKLVAAEAGAQVGRGAEGDLNRLLKTARAAVAAGQKEPPGTAQLEAQLAEVSADVIRAEGGARELNHGLRAASGSAAGLSRPVLAGPRPRSGTPRKMWKKPSAWACPIAPTCSFFARCSGPGTRTPRRHRGRRLGV